MKAGTYESEIWQHKTLDLVYAMWSDNNIVKTLSNFHSPNVLPAGDGVRRKRRVDGKREQHRTEVTCPEQNKAYSATFHQIDKGNSNEANYDMGGHSKGHNWSPKLTMRFFNMNLNNAHLIYKLLTGRHTPLRRTVTMEEGVKELAHTLMQRGESVRVQEPEHPQFTRDLTSVFDTGSGRRVRSDAKGVVASSTAQPRISKRVAALRQKQKRLPWRKHQSVAYHMRGRCHYSRCPATKTSAAERKRSYLTFMRCEECSAVAGKDMFFCNDTKSKKPCLCHLAYHTKYHAKK